MKFEVVLKQFKLNNFWVKFNEETEITVVLLCKQTLMLACIWIIMNDLVQACMMIDAIELYILIIV